MNVPIYQVDAFSSKLFGGNPAAICPLDEWLPDATLQSIAAENNLAETAYYIQKNGKYHLRWFTPGVEVDLCGHATLAAAHVIMDIRREVPNGRVSFESKSGELIVNRDGDLYALDFPARPPSERPSDEKLFDALGARPKHLLGSRDLLCVFDTQAEVLALKPNMERLAAIDSFATIVTAPGSDCDFVSRFFAPAQGIPEDPVTGSAHCTLIPYWASRLGKTKMFARQISPRGGELWCEHRGDRVTIAGRAVKYLEGVIEVPQ
jgi:PhzF family phenazine biosynthesis protein